MFFWDCAMQPGGVLLSPIFLCIAITLDGSLEKMSGKMKALFIVPTATILITWTNPLHIFSTGCFPWCAARSCSAPGSW